MSDAIVFRIPNVKYQQDVYPQTALRHYLVIRDAMLANDKHTVGNRQLRLLHAGLEIPITVEQCNKYLRKYDVTKTSQ